MGKFLDTNGCKIERGMSGRSLEDQRTHLMGVFKKKKAFVIFNDIWGNCKNGGAMSYWLDIFHGDGSAPLITTWDKSILNQEGATKRSHYLKKRVGNCLLFMPSNLTYPLLLK